MKASVRSLIPLAAILVAACNSNNADPLAGAPVTGSPPAGPPMGLPPVPTPPAPPTGTGRVEITAIDPTGRPLNDVGFGYSCPLSGCNFGHRAGGGPGTILFDTVPVGPHEISVSHPLGWTRVYVDVTNGQSFAATARIEPKAEATAAVLAASIPAVSLSADRTELELHLSVAVSEIRPETLVPPNESWLYGAEIENCTPGSLPGNRRCIDGPAGDAPYAMTGPAYPSGVAMAPASTRQIPPATSATPRETMAVLALLDQGERAPRYDRFGLRHLALRRFAARLRTDDQLWVGGFAGTSATAGTPPMLQALPLWVSPYSTPQVAIDDLVPRVGGGSPLLDALDEATERVGAAGGAGHTRALVVFTAGSDETVAAAERTARWQTLSQRQAALGVEMILVVRGQHPPTADVLELVEANVGKVILLRSPDDDSEWSLLDDLYSAAGLAADLLTGSSRSHDLVFRLRSGATGAFAPGSVIRGKVVLWNDCAPGWWWCKQAVPFVARVP